MCEAAFGKKAPGVEVYDGDTAQVLRDSCVARVHLSTCLCITELGLVLAYVARL